MKEIPNTDDWQPSKERTDSFQKILFEKCRRIEMEIVTKLEEEKSYNINNFDSGLVIEKTIRDSIIRLLPGRYKIHKGIINDREGKTSGEHDIVIFNDFWFPYLTGNSDESDRLFFPIEGVYAIGEVKQKLTIESLDSGLKKLITAQRLKRPIVGDNRYSENRKTGDHELGISNSLFTFLIAVTSDEGLSKDSIFNRFFEINKSLYRDEMVRALCIIDDFFISWAVLNNKGDNYDIALFNSKDIDEPILPIVRTRGNEQSSFYDLMIYLSGHLNASILGSEDIFVAYGNDNSQIQAPPENEYRLYSRR